MRINRMPIRIFIILMGMMSVNIFFSISSIFGYEFMGTESSKSYLIYCVMVAILNIFLCANELIFRKKSITYVQFILLTIPFWLILVYVITVLKQGYSNPVATDFLRYSLIWAVPAVYTSIYVNKKYLIKDIVKWMDVIMILYTLSIISSTIFPFLKGQRFTTVGGATYQTASYISAFAYGINLYFISFGMNQERFGFTKSKLYKLFSIGLLGVQLVGIIISGGRGGIVLASLYTIYISGIIFKERKISKIFKWFLSTIGIIGILITCLPVLMENEMFANGFRRVFEFISPTGKINWEGTSNRDDAYLSAINLIKNKPIFGYGLYGVWEVSGYPHNIILEILLHGGMVYLSSTVGIFVWFCIKLRKMIKIDTVYRFLFIFFLFPITMLMFSGTYTNNSEFWFIVALILGCEINKLKE